MKIGILCYASVGGSGVVATELAHELAARGHYVHVLSSERPFRWRDGHPNLVFEPVEPTAYPLFREPQYLLALATSVARVACEQRLDVIHAHYAVPHATAAYLADRMLAADVGACRPRTVTTLHGTDVTLVGSDPSYRRVVKFSIEQSHAVTAVSESLKHDTLTAVGVGSDIRVIPNFLDCEAYSRRPDPDARRAIAPDGVPIIMHVSNFRPVKRVDIVFEVFRRLRERRDARLVLVGDGPDRLPLARSVGESRFADDVQFFNERPDLASWLSLADAFLLPSAQESFGLAALEAMACEVPVVVSRVGGLPEVVEDGVTGYLCDPDDVDAMVDRLDELCADPRRRADIGRAAAEVVRTRFCAGVIVPQYEKVYDEVLKQSFAAPAGR